MNTRGKHRLIPIFIITAYIFGGELSVDSFIHKVLAVDIGKEETELTFEELHARRSQLKAGWFPSLSYSMNSIESQQGPRELFIGSVSIPQPATTYYWHSSSLNMNFQLFDYGNSLRKMKGLGATLDAARYEHFRKSRDLIIKALDVFYQAAEAEELKQLYEEEFVELNRQADQIKDLVEKGVKPAIDQLRFEVQLNEIRSKIHSQSVNIVKLRSDLVYYTKDSSLYREGLRIPELKQGDLTDNFSGSPPSMSPELKKYEAQIQAREYEQSVIQWDKFPDIYFRAGYQRSSNLFDDIYNDFNKNWNINYSLSLSYPLFQNRQNKLKATQKRIEVFRLKQQLLNEKARIEKEYQDLMTTIQSERQLWTLYLYNKDHQESIYRYEHDRYTSGLTEYKEMVAEKQALLGNRQSLISTKFKLLKSLGKFDVLSGKWDDAITTYLKAGF